MTTRVTVCMAEDAVIVLHDTEADILAVRQRGFVEVWRADGETHMGNLPIDASERDIRLTTAFWYIGLINGVRFGRDEAQAKLRAALGLGADAK